MINRYLSCYHRFQCIAAACPDSCCIGWDIVVDDDTYTTYQSVEGTLGEKLRRIMKIDADGDRIFTLLEQDRCPFWNQDHLCDLQLNLGETGLCTTCRRFPRIQQDYGNFVEYTLSMACPEAARLILSEYPLTIQTEETDDHAAEPLDYDWNEMQFLLDSRMIVLKILSDAACPIWNRIIRCLQYGEQLQQQWEQGLFCPLPQELPLDKTRQWISTEDGNALLRVHLEMEHMTEQFPRLLQQAIERVPSFRMLPLEKEKERKLENFCIYMAYRYHLQAIADGDILIKLKRMAAAVFVICQIEKTGDISLEEGMRLYDKEVAHSYENAELLETALQNLFF